MRNVLGAALTGVFLAGGMVMASDAAAQSYPRTVCSGGESCTVDYGPMGQGNLVGGGRVMVSMPDGMSVAVLHLDTQFAQQPRAGFVPVTVGTGENMQTIYVPQSMVEMIRGARTRASGR